MPRSSSDTLRRLVTAHAAGREQVAVFAAQAASREARRFTGWYDTAAITAMTLRIVALVEAAQRQTAALTDAYMARVLAELLGKPVQPLGPVSIDGLRKGISHPGVYGRLADQYRYERSLQTPPDEVLQHVVERAAVMAQTDTDLAFRAQAHAYTGAVKLGVTGYRRVLHPELSKGGTCGLCIVAADRIYYRDRLMPMHDRCHCGVLPILGELDPGQTLNAEDLRTLYKQAGTTGAADLKKVRVAVRNHSELGPVLRDASQAFRGPAAVAADTAH